MGEEVYVSFETGGDAVWVLGDYYFTEYWRAMRFTTAAGISCTSASMNLQMKNGDPTGDISFRIETDDSNKPSGTLAHANAESAIPKGEESVPGWNKCSFTKFTLPAGTYWLVIKLQDQPYNHFYGLGCATVGVGVSGESTNHGASWAISTDENVSYYRIYREIPVASKFRDEICFKGLPGGTSIRGQVNKEFIYAVKNKQQRKYAYFIPANPQTVDQQAWRAKFTAGIAAAKLLSEAEIAVYKKTAYRKKGQTWHSCFMSWYLWKESHS